MSKEEVKHWIKQVSIHRAPSREQVYISPRKVLVDLEQYQAEKNLYINSNTFTSGFISVVHAACSADNDAVVQYVLDNHGTQFNINELLLYDPYPYVLPNNNQYVVKSILDQRKQTLVHVAVIDITPYNETRSHKLLKLLVSHGASVNVPDCCSVTPLLRSVACDNPNKDIVKFLLKCGADIHYRDIYGQTVLMYAVSNKADNNIVSLLLKNGADPTLIDERGYTVLHHATATKNLDAINLLLSFEISPILCPQGSKSHALFLADKMEFMDKDKFFGSSFKPGRSPPQVITDVITKHPQCPPHLKVDSILLNATFLFSINNVYNLACRFCLNEALTLRAQLNLPPPRLFKCNEAYGGLTEVASIEELKEKYYNFNETTTLNMAYQSLIIRERCLGYGDSTAIICLFEYGKFFIAAYHYKEGLFLLHRGTEMLLSRLRNGIMSDQGELIELIESGYKCCDVLTGNRYNLSHFLIPKINAMPDDLCQDLFVPLLINLMECQQLSTELYLTKKYHAHDELYGSQMANSILLTVLEFLYDNPIRGVNVPYLCRKAFEKCHKFPARSPLYSNLLDIALTLFNPSISVHFLSLLLESGGSAFINEVGRHGFRPLTLARTKEVTLLLLAHGAHPDAVSRLIPEFKRISNYHIDDYFCPPLPLSCLAAKFIISESISYQSMDLPYRLVKFIAMHDQLDIGFTENDCLPYYYDAYVARKHTIHPVSMN